MISLNVVRYLSFEVTKLCNMTAAHPLCPINDPERYRFGDSSEPLSDELIVQFWRWARFTMDFRGIILWHGYSEPTLVLPRIYALMDRMRDADPGQPFHLFTNSTRPVQGFDLIKRTRYGPGGKDLDARRETVTGEGKPYAEMQAEGWCGRGWGWEVWIDHHGNWNLCCNDWRCEESVGNIRQDDWTELLMRYHAKATQLRWHDEPSYQALPRLCRACLDKNPNLHRSGATF